MLLGKNNPLYPLYPLHDATEFGAGRADRAGCFFLSLSYIERLLILVESLLIFIGRLLILVGSLPVEKNL